MAEHTPFSWELLHDVKQGVEDRNALAPLLVGLVTPPDNTADVVFDILPIKDLEVLPIKSSPKRHEDHGLDQMSRHPAEDSFQLRFRIGLGIERQHLLGLDLRSDVLDNEAASRSLGEIEEVDDPLQLLLEGCP